MHRKIVRYERDSFPTRYIKIQYRKKKDRFFPDVEYTIQKHYDDNGKVKNFSAYLVLMIDDNYSIDAHIHNIKYTRYNIRSAFTRLVEILENIKISGGKLEKSN